MIYSMLLLILFKSNSVFFLLLLFPHLHSFLRSNCIWNALNIPVYLSAKVQDRTGVLDYRAITSVTKRNDDFTGYSVMEITGIELLCVWPRQGGMYGV